MTIKNGWYIAECTSDNEPISRLDAGTFYLPVDVKQIEAENGGGYRYKEYRFNIPVDYDMPREVYGLLCNALANAVNSYHTLAYRTEATEDALIELAGIIAGGE